MAFEKGHATDGWATVHATQGFPVKPCDENLLKTLDLVGRMMRLADQGDSQREDIGCGILYGVMRDAAYKIQKLAQAEQKAHKVSHRHLDRRLADGLQDP